MISRFWMVLLALLAPEASAQVDLRLDLEPLKAEIGQPVSVVLTAEHGDAIQLVLPDSVLPDDSWLLIDEAQRLTLPHPSREGLVVSVVRWEVASLESGERVFNFPGVGWEDGKSTGVTEVAAPTLSVAAALAEGEDAARPALMFREPDFAPAPISRWPWVVGGAVALFILLLVLKRKGGGRAPAEEELSPRKQLDTLEARLAELGIRGSFYELSTLVRRALDEGGESLAGMTDEEWLLARAEDPRSSRAECAALRALFARCAEVKYGQAEPTQWALEDSLKAAKELAHGAVSTAPEVAA